ncbi:uncharacterized protein ARMOST_20816 [Armillaria ostoyae]|uniref:Uncharacterized protein n=1 Tax=Armillaria ostoyae TaxID=47428 RepID=A0A284S8C5_ARMOS|nr:uncharacterized protein ARMOST_20816 [Armillaria ostoyae]
MCLTHILGSGYPLRLKRFIVFSRSHLSTANSLRNIESPRFSPGSGGDYDRHYRMADIIPPSKRKAALHRHSTRAFHAIRKFNLEIQFSFRDCCNNLEHLY